MSGKNPHLRNRYATLNDIIDTARKPLADNGLSYVQMPCNPESIDIPFIGLTTRIMHASGQWVETTVYFPMDGGANKAVSAVQAAGSVLTYMRRYALAAALGIVADEDADGNAPPAQQQVNSPTAPPAANGKAQTATDPGPLPDDELTIEEAPAAQFIAAAAGLLETDTDTLKARLKALGYERIPGKPAERVAAYRRLRDDPGHADDIMAAAQPALVTVAEPATDYKE